jgi:cytochrome P450
MLVHPDVQSKAQEEIDQVCSTDDLPSFGEQAAYPYVTAIVMEIFRWAPITPLGVLWAVFSHLLAL